MNRHNSIVHPIAFTSNGVNTRSQMSLKTIINRQLDKVAPNGKRKAENSPTNISSTARTKRLAFGDLTNNGKSSLNNSKKPVGKKAVAASKAEPDKQSIKPSSKVDLKLQANAKITINGKQTLHSTSSIAPRKTFVEFGKPLVPAGITVVKIENSLAESKANVSEAKKDTVPKVTVEVVIPVKDVPMKAEKASPDSSSFCSASSSSSSENNSLYVTARDILSPPDVIIPHQGTASTSRVKSEQKRRLIPQVPPNVNDFDQENLNDPNQISIYAMDVFKYLRERESKFVVNDYMSRQICLSTSMRALLVDWMVEVQETFELNHETLYLAVKLVDLYLSKMTVGKETLQLIGAASIFIASKFDERTPPLVDDFLYICDGAYTHTELIKAEMNVIKLVDFDLGIPLSYRFLRRYARCAKLTMPILTLARFVLEYSLMEYSFAFYSDSKLAAACLLLALKMKNLSGWTPSLEYYTGYKVDTVRPLAMRLNELLHRHPKDNLSTIRNKYSHKIFFEVAKTPLISNRQLC